MIEQTVRQILSQLGTHETLSTAELGKRVHADLQSRGMQPAAIGEVYRVLDKLGASNRELCELVPGEGKSGFNRGKPIKRRVWHRIESPAMPERPHTQSAGAASPGTSLTDRVHKLEEWAARTDPLFRVL